MTALNNAVLKLWTKYRQVESVEQQKYITLCSGFQCNTTVTVNYSPASFEFPVMLLLFKSWTKLFESWNLNYIPVSEEYSRKKCELHKDCGSDPVPGSLRIVTMTLPKTADSVCKSNSKQYLETSATNFTKVTVVFEYCSEPEWSSGFQDFEFFSLQTLCRFVKRLIHYMHW